MSAPMLEVSRLVKHFTKGGGVLGGSAVVRAVDDVSFDVRQGEIFGLIGESGSGKTTLLRCLLRLIEPTSGAVRFRGEDLLTCSRSRLRDTRRHLQMVFQDAHTALNPRLRVREIVEEPLVIHRIGDRPARQARVAELLGQVGLDDTIVDRRPHELSGGQRQRIGLARALALSPSLILLDEPVSSLDASVQAQVVDLLLDLRARQRLTYLFVAHDLRLVEGVSDRVAVMRAGRIVEMGPAAAVFANPRHPYTRALLSARPVPDPAVRLPRLVFDPSAVDPSAPLVTVGEGHVAAV